MRSRFPAAFRPPAFASRVIPVPPGKWAFLTVGLPDTISVGTLSGVTTFHTHENDRGGCLLYPGDGGALLDRMPCPTSACRITTACPCTPLEHPTGRAIIHEASTKVHAIHPPGLPLTRDPRVGQGSFGFPLGLRTLPLPATHAKGGARHRARARDYTTDITSAS